MNYLLSDGCKHYFYWNSIHNYKNTEMYQFNFIFLPSMYFHSDLHDKVLSML